MPDPLVIVFIIVVVVSILLYRRQNTDEKKKARWRKVFVNKHYSQVTINLRNQTGNSTVNGIVDSVGQHFVRIIDPANIDGEGQLIDYLHITSVF